MPWRPILTWTASLTGSTETGRRIIEASTVNIRKLQLELGGKSADIICADADLDKAVPGAAMGVFANSGRICFAGTRVLVQRSIVDEFTKRLLAFMDTLRVGHSLDDDQRAYMYELAAKTDYRPPRRQKRPKIQAQLQRMLDDMTFTLRLSSDHVLR